MIVLHGARRAITKFGGNMILHGCAYMQAPGSTMRGRAMPSFVKVRNSSIRNIPPGVVTL